MPLGCGTRWFFCGVNLKEVQCQSPACELSSLLPTPPCSALCFRKLHFPGSTDSGLQLSLVTEKHWAEMEGPEHRKRRVPFCLLSWESIAAMAACPVCLLCVSNNGQTRPVRLQLQSGGLGSWESLCPSSPEKVEAKLGVASSPSLFGILALQLLKWEIPWIKPPLSEISSDDFCLPACTLSDTGSKLHLMEKKSGTGCGQEKNEGLEGSFSLWERKT